MTGSHRADEKTEPWFESTAGAILPWPFIRNTRTSRHQGWPVAELLGEVDAAHSSVACRTGACSRDDHHDKPIPIMNVIWSGAGAASLARTEQSQ